jgi:Arc/MetJ family transcription regulator
MPCGPLRWPAWHRGRRVEGKRVKRMTFNADADLLARAQQVLGTATATDTINTALAEVVRRDDLSRLVDLVPPDLTPEMLRELRKPREF